jgi:predicted nucleic acid-binding protein
MSDKAVLNETLVVNASPLITLGKAGLDYILPGLFENIVIPGAVWHEISHYQDTTWKKLLNAQWLGLKEITTDSRISLWNLGEGESEVLSWSLKNRHIAAVDDLAARRCCAALHIRHIGTAGILVLASRYKLIPSLRTAFEEVKKAGLFLKPELINQLLEKEAS